MWTTTVVDRINRLTLRSGSKTGADDSVRQKGLESLGLPSDYDFLSSTQQRLLWAERDAKAQAYTDAVFAAEAAAYTATQAQMMTNALAASGAGPSATPASAIRIDLTGPEGKPKQRHFLKAHSTSSPDTNKHLCKPFANTGRTLLFARPVF